MNWVEVLSSSGFTLAGAGIIGFFLNEKIRTSLTVQMQRDLNKQKQELDLLTEKIKFELQREMIKVQLYNQSSQLIYPEMYKKILIAHGSVIGLMGLKRVPDYKKYETDDVRELLTKRSVPNSSIEEIVRKYSISRAAGVEALEKLIRLIELDEAQNEFAEVKDFWLINELYLDDEISDTIGSFLDDLWIVYVDAEMSILHNHFFENDKVAKERLEPTLKAIKNKIRAKLMPYQSKIDC